MEQLLAQQKTLMLSTLTPEKTPSISYAPYIMRASDIYIYISETAEHYHNLITNPVCAVMIIEDEENAKTIFARQRVSFIAHANRVEDDKEVYQWFEEEHNATIVERLRTMNFSFFKLTLKKGRLVKGFGQAFDISYTNGIPSLVSVSGDGHSHQPHPNKQKNTNIN